MFILKQDISIQKVYTQVNEDTPILTIYAALKRNLIAQETYNFLTSNHYEYLIMGENTIFASNEDGLYFTEYVLKNPYAK